MANEGFFLLKSPTENGGHWNPGNGAIPQGRYPHVGILNPFPDCSECHGGRRREPRNYRESQVFQDPTELN